MGVGFDGFHTPLCDLLGIRYPVFLAGMAGGLTTPRLVAEISNAGGLGILGAARLSPEQTRAQIREIRSMTDKPFGVNFLVAPPQPNDQDIRAVQKTLDAFRQELGINPSTQDNITVPPSRLSEQLDVVFEEKVPVISFALGDPGRFVKQAHESGAKVLAMVTTVEEALKVASGGSDVIVAQGSEAGGHRSTFEIPKDGSVPLIGTMALVPQVVDATKVPVVAAGGIMDGRGIAACLALGAQGVQLGTRFLAANESGAFMAYKLRMLGAAETDTVITSAFTGRPARSIKNRFITEFEKSGVAPLSWPLQGLAADDIYQSAWAKNNANYFPILAGQGLRMLKSGQSAAEIMEDLVKETRASVVKLTKLTNL